tara:strand:- start:180 stop:1124 length:945 start_codon:yes stop_codon:yes gene_type:complete
MLKRFYLPTNTSPAFDNLSWHLSRLGWHKQANNALITAEHFNFNEHVANTLEYKHLLAQFIHQYLPQGIMPLTYEVDDTNWPSILALIAAKRLANRVWILKPALLNNGQHIHLFESLDDIAKHFKQSKRLGGTHVLQHYLTPHLLRDNRKYSIRCFMVLTSHAQAYLYPTGYMNVAKTPYSADLTALSAHLTNEHLFEQQTNVIQIPSSQFSWYPTLLPHIKRVLSTLSQQLMHHYTQAFCTKNPLKWAIFGMDFMLDNTQHLWLLEANHGPCFPSARHHPLQAYVYDGFWCAFIKQFIDKDLQLTKQESLIAL